MMSVSVLCCPLTSVEYFIAFEDDFEDRVLKQIKTIKKA